VVRTLIPHLSTKLIAEPLQGDQGFGREIADKLLCIFYHHSTFDTQQELGKKAAELLWPLIEGDPEFGSLITESFIEERDDIPGFVSKYIDFILKQGDIENASLMFLEVTGLLTDTSGNNPIYKQLGKITDSLSVYCSTWSTKQLDYFLDVALFVNHQEIEDVSRFIKRSKAGSKFIDMLCHCGVDSNSIQKLQNLIGGGDESISDILIPVDGKNQFEDLNFKLLVIEKLMYRDALLTPRFDIHEFARLYTGREILIDDEGYESIPEALAWFEGILIPDELLGAIEELGFNPAAEVYSQIQPFWDGESEEFDPKSIEDLDKLPNLRNLYSMPGNFAHKYESQLKERGIEITSM
jgi:hypothetical protein